ncbi:MAG TPA: carboxymuconolactone decarboxylase family protein [Dehalococcoidia bacterium]|nr:carboxymuconolactone decarboxylase family protein [Dehalococcoidia bacterium]
MNERSDRPAWIALPSEEDVRARIPPGKRDPYDFGFVAGMTRLIQAHDRIGPAFAHLYAQVMFGRGHLDRREREMVAAVAAAAQDCHY